MPWDRLGYSESPAQLFEGLELRTVAAFKIDVVVRQWCLIVVQAAVLLRTLAAGGMITP